MSVLDFSPSALKKVEADTFRTPLRCILRRTLDFDIYLYSVGENLQRPLVWTKHQREELIWSALIGRYIPPVAICTRTQGEEDVSAVVDGKQRLSTLLAFYENTITVPIEGKDYYFQDLPKSWRSGFEWNTIPISEALDLSEEEIVAWFLFLNYAGTNQEKQHLEKLSQIHKILNARI